MRQTLYPVVPTTGEIPGGKELESLDFITNEKIANHLDKIAGLFEKAKDSQRVFAYAKAANGVRNHGIPVAKIDLKAGDIKYVGPSIVQLIDEFLETGTTTRYQTLKAQFPDLPDLSDLERIPGVGPRSAEKLYEQFHVTTVAEVEKLLIDGKIDDEKLKKAVAYISNQAERIPFSEAFLISRTITQFLELVAKDIVVRVSTAGSLRRQTPTIKDVDILVAVEDQHREQLRLKIKENWPADIYADGPTRTRLRIENRGCDIIYTNPKCWGAALNYLTGSAQFNVKVREFASKQGVKINEFGAWDKKTGSLISALPEEEDLFRMLGLKWVSPMERTPDRNLEEVK